MVSPGGEAAEVGLKADLLRGAAAGELDVDVDFVDERRVFCFELTAADSSFGSCSIGDIDS